MTPKVHIKITSRTNGLLDVRWERPKGINYDKPMNEFTQQERSILILLSVIGRAVDEFNRKIMNGGKDDVPAEGDQLRSGDLPGDGPAVDGVSPTELPAEVGGVQLEDGGRHD